MSFIHSAPALLTWTAPPRSNLSLRFPSASHLGQLRTPQKARRCWHRAAWPPGAAPPPNWLLLPPSLLVAQDCTHGRRSGYGARRLRARTSALALWRHLPRLAITALVAETQTGLTSTRNPDVILPLTNPSHGGIHRNCCLPPGASRPPGALNWRAAFRCPLYGGAAGVKVVRAACRHGSRRLQLNPPRSAKFLASRIRARRTATGGENVSRSSRSQLVPVISGECA